MTEVEREFDAERARLVRSLRQRLESLARAGVSCLPRAEAVAIPGPPVAEMDATPSEVVAEIEAAVHAPPEPPKPAPAPTPPRPKPAEPRPATFAPARGTSLFEEPGIQSPPVPAEDRPAILSVLAAEVAGCTRCPQLAATRTQTVFADGSPTARLMFIGEAPGRDEDLRGLPFVGKAGQLLNDMITKGMGLRREDVYIANILKCRPPENRDPAPEESANCLGYLERQIEVVRPEYICLLGRLSAQTMLDTMLSMGRLRGRWHRVRGIPAIATYHPAYLLRTPSAKKDAWEDLQVLMRAMGISAPARQPKGG